MLKLGQFWANQDSWSPHPALSTLREALLEAPDIVLDLIKCWSSWLEERKET